MKLLLNLIVLSTSLNVMSQISTDSLKVHYMFDGNAYDSSGYNYHGSVNGATLTTDRYGNNNKAYLFDGINDYINVSSPAELNGNLGQITISAWIKPNSQFLHTVVAKGSMLFLMQLAKTLRPGIIYSGLTIDYGTSENYWGRILPYTTLPANKWSHFVSTYSKSDGIVTLYVDGLVVHQSIASGDILASTDDLRIGARIDATFPEYFNGAIDDLRIYTRALSSSEVSILSAEKPTNVHESIPNYGVLFYPNPTSGLFFIEKTDGLSKEMNIKLFDITSKVIVETVIPLNQQKIEYDISALSQGIYYLQFTIGDDRVVKKIVKN